VAVSQQMILLIHVAKSVHSLN